MDRFSSFCGCVVTAVRGFLVGLADLVPGVSGGTMAYLLGIYPRLLCAVSSLVPSLPLRVWFRGVDLSFLLPFAVGGLSAVFVLTRVIDFPDLLERHAVFFQALFSGLIFGAVVIFMSSVRVVLRDCVLLVVVFVCGMLLLLQFPFPFDLPATDPVLFLSGLAASGAMLVPGVSGSYLLFVFGLYEVVLDALGQVHFPVLLPFLSGVALGLLLFARVLALLLLRYRQPFLVIINALLLVSLFRLWPLAQLLPELAGHGRLTVSGGGVPAWLSLFAGVAITWLLHYLAKPASPG